MITADLSSEQIVEVALAMKNERVPPHQSNFRVFCIMTYTDSDGEFRWITGSNTEACNIHSSFCAERSALVKLRDSPTGFDDLKRVRALYLVCDGLAEITPGMLCREMLASFISHDTPIHMGARLADGSIRIRRTDIRRLLPYPPVYHHLRASEVELEFARFDQRFPPAKLLKQIESQIAEGVLTGLLSPAINTENLLKLAQQVQIATAKDNHNVHSLNLAAGVLFADGDIYVTHQNKGLEYGTTIPVDCKAITEIFRRVEQSKQPKSEPRAVCLLISDHHGVWHSPCGQARALLHEFGFDALRVVCLSVSTADSVEHAVKQIHQSAEADAAVAVADAHPENVHEQCMPILSRKGDIVGGQCVSVHLLSIGELSPDAPSSDALLSLAEVQDS